MRIPVMHLSKLAICYLLISFCLGFANCSFDPKNNSSLQPQSSRNLDQIPDDLSDEKLILSPQLNPGELLGYFNPGHLRDPDSISLVISKNGKTLFTMFNDDLIIYNVFNPAKPRKVGLLTDIGGWTISMLLSPDDKILYLYGNQRIRVINVTNLTSPNEIGFREIEMEVGDDTLYSQAISADGKILYTVNQECFNVWDVSDPDMPSFLDEKKGKYAGGIAISKSNKMLALGLKKKFQIWNIEDPEEMKLLGTKTTKGDVYSMAFSDDEKRLFIGMKKESQTAKVQPNLEIYNITNLKSPSLLVSTKLADEATSGRLWFHSNEEYAFYTTPYEFNPFQGGKFFQKRQLNFLHNSFSKELLWWQFPIFSG